MAKIGRNQPCPCGSGKKYKHCCFGKVDFSVSEITMPDIVDGLMDEGYLLLEEYKTQQACDTWLELWEELKTRFKPEFNSIRDADILDSGSFFIYDWCQEFESQLGNAGIDDPVYYQKRIDYCDEFCALFPESDVLIMQNMKRASAESYFALGNSEIGTKRFKLLIEQYPRHIWGYIGWGDMYYMQINKDIKPDYKKAEQIYLMALGKGMEDEDDLLERLETVKRLGRKASAGI